MMFKHLCSDPLGIGFQKGSHPIWNVNRLSRIPSHFWHPALADSPSSPILDPNILHSVGGSFSKDILSIPGLQEQVPFFEINHRGQRLHNAQIAQKVDTL